MSRKRNTMTRRNSPLKGLSLIAAATIGILVAANLMVSNTLATSGDRLHSLLKRKQTILNQNSRIRQVITENSALRTIELKANALGFTPENQIMSLAIEPQVALRSDDSE